jgi:hypothetical protein
MLFSTNQGNIKPQILFNNEDVEFVINHKHLDVTFSSNCKWHCHIQNILKSTSGQNVSEFNLCSISFILEDEYDSDVSSANNRERL